MASYRQSSYDPYAVEQPGPPLRPYNWVQRVGVACSVTGGSLAFAYLLGKAGWIPQILDDVAPATVLVMLGVALVNSRRGPGTPMTPEIRRKRILIILGAFTVGAIAVAVAILNSQGA